MKPDDQTQTQNHGQTQANEANQERTVPTDRTFTRRKWLAAMGLAGAGMVGGGLMQSLRSHATENPHGKIGDLSALYTAEKSNIVGAMNEQHAQIDTCEEDLRDRGINVKHPPTPLTAAVGDGVTDDTAALQAIADYARTHHKMLFFPNGAYFVTQDLTLYTSILCYGEIVSPSAGEDTLIHIARTKPHQTVNGSQLSGLFKGSTQIQGLEGLKGSTVWFQSSELLIRRTPPAIGTYWKREAFVVNDDHGQITPALDYTYDDPSSITAHIYPQEPPLVIDGLRIRTTGDTQGFRTLVNCVRSDVVFRNLSIQNDSQQTVLERGVGVVRSCNVTFEHANIRGFEDRSSVVNLGYGVTVSESATVAFINCSINDCRHAISGRYGKNVRVIGGSYSQNIDTHWGNNWVVDGATFVSNAPLAVNFCGTDVTVVNCTFYGSPRMIVAIRNDTPELDGTVIVKNNRLYTDMSWVRLVGFPGQNNTHDNFGKVLENPKFVIIEGNYIEAPPATPITLLHAGGVRNYEQRYWGNISISRNHIRNGNPLTAVFLSANQAFMAPLNRPPVIWIEQQIFNNQSTASGHLAVWLPDRTAQTGISNQNLCCEVQLTDCRNVQVDISPSMVSRVSFVRSSVSRVVKGTVGHATPINGEYHFTDCELQSCAFLYRAPTVFQSCVFEGAASGDDIQDNAILTLNNVAKLGAANYPSPLHGKKDAMIYQ